jgi:hypothetical protein
LLAAASQILRRFGLRVSGAVAAGHDVLTVSALPLAETQYDFVVNDRNEAGGIVPCMKTSFFADVAEFTRFEADAAGGIVPRTKTTGAGPATTFEQLDVNEAGGIVPCMKTFVEAPLTTFEIFDPNAAGGIIPCMHVAAERLADGSLGPVEVAVEEPDLSLVVRIGALTYRLVDGRLVEV